MATHRVSSKDSDQAAWMRWLIRVFPGPHVICRFCCAPVGMGCISRSMLGLFLELGGY